MGPGQRFLLRRELATKDAVHIQATASLAKVLGISAEYPDRRLESRAPLARMDSVVRRTGDRNGERECVLMGLVRGHCLVEAEPHVLALVRYPRYSSALSETPIDALTGLCLTAPPIRHPRWGQMDLRTQRAQG